METRLPETLAEVESLVIALYEPSSPEVISRVQDTLHRVQRSPSGWRFARDLLRHTDDKVKFFGALTIIVKLNTESDKLSEHEALELLQGLCGWLAVSLTDGSGSMVVRKLTSALVTFFLHFPSYWNFCVRNLGASLASPDAQRSGLSEPIDFQIILSNLDHRRLQAILWFATTLVEEAGKTDMNSGKHIDLYNGTLCNVSDVVTLMSHCFAMGDTQPAGIHHLLEDNIRCYQSWIWFSQRVALRGNDIVESLRSLIEPTILALYSDELFEVAGELVSDVLANYSGFFLEKHYDALFDMFNSQWAEQRYRRLIEGDFDFDSVLFGQLMLAMGDSQVQKIIESGDSRSQSFILKLRGLVCAAGYPVVEDKIFVPALEFWSTFIETMIDGMYSDETQAKQWLSTAISHTLEVISGVWRKVSFPPTTEYSSWDSADRVAFSDARKDVADLLQSTFTVTGPRLVTTFAELVLQRLDPSQWMELEAAAFCLGSLADCVVEDTCDQTLKAVFSSDLFAVLQQSRDTMPSRVRQTCISLIERYAEYFERNTGSLPDALRLLFLVLPDTKLAGPASKSIQRLCSSSRSILANEVGAFIQQYGLLVTRQQLDCLASERICGAIASITQAVVEESERLHYLEQLLAFVQNDVTASLRLVGAPAGEHTHECLLNTDASDPAEHLALKALRCLVCIGKGFQVPVEGPVNLDSGRRVAYTGQEDKLQYLQTQLWEIIENLHRAFPRSGEIVETTCTILRTGFSETETGPFVFPPRKISSLLIQQSHPGVRLGLFVSAACSFVSSLDKSVEDGLDLLRSQLLAWVVDLLLQSPEPDHDTELAQNGIEFVSRLLSKNPEILLWRDSAAVAEHFFAFSLRILDGKEPLPKAAAADFWATFVSLASSNSSLQEVRNNILEHLGPSLARCLIRNVGGNAARSELDKLSEPIKKLVSQHVKARLWLEEGLFHQDFPGDQLSPEDRAAFLKKIISLRGARATNQVIREFWLAARGSKFAYAS